MFENLSSSVCAPKFVCYRMLLCLCMRCRSCVHMYVCMFAYVLACIFIYLHIFLLSVGGKEWDKRRECKKRRLRVRGGNWLLQSEFLFLSNFMVAKSLFWFEYEISVFWGNFVKWWWWLKSKSFLHNFFLMWYRIYGQVIKMIGFGCLL